MSAKAETEKNYTAVQEDRIREFAAENGGFVTYENADKLADEFGKDVRSIRAKASRMELYRGKAKQSVNGGAVETKEEIAADIAAIVGRNLDSLEKASKPQLVILRDYIKSLAA